MLLEAKAFSQRLRVAMARTNVSSSVLAMAVGCSPQMVNAMCRGERLPSRAVLEAICEALDVSLNWIGEPGKLALDPEESDRLAKPVEATDLRK